MDQAIVADGLTKNPLAWGLVLALGAIGVLFKLLSDERQRSADKLEATRKEHIETIKADAKEQREILFQIIPLTAKLTQAIETVERITDNLTRSNDP